MGVIKSMKKIIYLLLLFVLSISCTDKKNVHAYQLTPTEKKLCDSLQIDSTLIQDIRVYNSSAIEYFHSSLSKSFKYDLVQEVDSIPLKGFVFDEQHEKSDELIFKLKDGFKEKGYSIFLIENNFNIDHASDKIALLKTTDQFEVLKSVRTDGINYDITNDSLVSIIKKIDKKYSLELIGAGGDWCEFVIHNEPKDWKAFSKEIYAFCPDIVDQGAGTIEKLEEELKQSKRLFLWWD
jgi:hypothetical protein